MPRSLSELVKRCQACNEKPMPRAKSPAFSAPSARHQPAGNGDHAPLGSQCCVLIHDQFLAVSPDWSTEAGIGGGAHAHEPGFSANSVLTSHDLEPDWDTEMAWLSDGAFSDGLCCLIWPGYLS